MFVVFYKIQSTMFFALIIFILEILLIKRKKYWKIIRRMRNINDKDNFSKNYKFIVIN